MTSSHRLVLATTASHFTFPIFGCNYILTCLRVIPNEISSYFWVNKYRTGLSLGQLLWFCYLRDMSLDAKNCESMHAGKSHIYLAKCIKLFWVVLTVSNFPHDKPLFTFFLKKKTTAFDSLAVAINILSQSYTQTHKYCFCGSSPFAGIIQFLTQGDKRNDSSCQVFRWKKNWQ